MLRSSLIIIMSLLVVGNINAQNPDLKMLNKEAKSKVMEFASILKPSLKKALKTGGPASAIKVCSEVAPQTAVTVSENSDWNIKRVSLKARNHKTAIPDAWEQSVLETFDMRQAKGEPVAKMMYSEVVDGEFRFMKAQGVEKVCTICHGEAIKPEVKSALAEHFPKDMAQGYKLGQVRGAFSLRKKL